MQEYKGIKRSQSREIFYWLDEYCKNKDPQILENDIVLQDKVKKFHFKRKLFASFIAIIIWGGLAYLIYENYKG